MSWLESAEEVDAACRGIVALQVKRKTVIATEVAATNTMTSFVARLCGFDVKDDEASREKTFSRAKAIIKQTLLEKPQKPEDERVVEAAERELTMIRHMLMPVKMRRKEIEEEMELLAADLPVWQHFAVPSFKECGLAVIIGEAGNLSNYSTERKLWRRLGFGMAPGHEAHAYSTWRKAGGLNAEEWTRAGYSPQRLGQIYGVVTVPLIMHKSRSKYGEIYAKRRAHTQVTHPEWWVDKDGKPKLDKDGKPRSDHGKFDAGRVMTKALIADLWSAWRRSGSRMDPGPVSYLAAAASSDLSQRAA